jgi:hypothetical protein
LTEDGVEVSTGAWRHLQGSHPACHRVPPVTKTARLSGARRHQWVGPVPKALLEFDEAGRMKRSPLYDRIVDVCEELVKCTHLTRGRSGYLTDRYSERIESAQALMARVNQSEL